MNLSLKKRIGLVVFVLLFSCQKENSTETNPICEANTFTINLDATQCEENIQDQLGVLSLYDEQEDSKRSIRINGIPNHRVGAFPNRGNPNTISEVSQNFSMSRNPNTSSSITSGQGYTFGVLFSGVSLDPYTAEFFTTSGGQSNREWNITALTNTFNLGLDCNNGHVQPTGKYHYHGTPSAMLANLENDGAEMIHVGFAADGFPIYYKYAYQGSTLEAIASGYRLKSGERPGDGQSAPNGCYDGTYFQDYEYVADLSPLDQCNGMFGKTPQSEGEYFYVITDNFPSSPLCFSGSPDSSFMNRPGGAMGEHQGHHIVLDF